jgi:hypothetical protein
MNKLEKREFLIDFIKFYEGISEIDRSEDGYFLPEIDKFLELQKCTSPVL